MQGFIKFLSHQSAMTFGQGRVRLTGMFFFFFGGVWKLAFLGDLEWHLQWYVWVNYVNHLMKWIGDSEWFTVVIVFRIQPQNDLFIGWGVNHYDGKFGWIDLTPWYGTIFMINLWSTMIRNDQPWSTQISGTRTSNIRCLTDFGGNQFPPKLFHPQF